MLHHRPLHPFVKNSAAMLLAMGLTVPIARAQIVRPGDVLVVSESIDPQGVLKIYDGCTGALKHTFTDARWTPSGAGRHVAVAPDGTIWVSDLGTNRLYQYDTSLNPMAVEQAPCGAQVGGFDFDAAGRIWGVDHYASTLFCLTPGSGATSPCYSLHFRPWECDAMPNGLIAISDHPSTAVHIFDPASGTVVNSLTCTSGFAGGSYSLYAHSSGQILVNDSFSSQIVALDPSLPSGSACLWTIPLVTSGYPYTAGLDVNEPLGRLYVAVNRAGTYWLEQYELPSLRLLSATDMNASVITPFPAPHTLAVVPGGGCGVTPFCFGYGPGAICPCGNSGDPGHGCLSSFGLLGGGLLSASGTPSIASDSIRLIGSFLPPTTTGLFFQGQQQVNGGLGRAFGDGLRCVTGNVIRLGTRTASAGVASIGAGVPGDPPISSVEPVTPGQTRYYQMWYRNTDTTFCTPSLFNLTNGLTIDWGA